MSIKHQACSIQQGDHTKSNSYVFMQANCFKEEQHNYMMPISSISLSGSLDAFLFNMSGTARPSPLQLTQVMCPVPSQYPHP
mmetsp:Transcript_40653/g.53535  ORF Transcript_40653/g.53535 Transcript_40653/m.53535 type:complete len:82 (+) Transcript_40653:138-383(+)